MKVGFIGAGHIGKALAKKFVNAGYPVIISNSRGVESLQALVKELGELASAGTTEDAANADLVVLAVMWDQIAGALEKVKKQLAGKIVIDATNNMNSGADDQPTSIVISEQIPEAKVVKAFNTLMAATLDADPAVGNGKRVIFFSGDHQDAKETVGEIIAKLGFAGVDLGGLKQASPITEFAKPLSGLNLIML
ncbi:NADPH-dependent F420 reductase [Pedobacter sp. MC2016-15]|uniref:NADPH-dependent F420 reductase n=1 Tax=Pedobacter sp. MC2016-15 TaxID=2994473 RepID=UPI002245BD9A|nr:NADPH-dependent F420 reductase [Pedobacter sp. MC2016-15]MCX2477979.1 NADPH-dependent F420 reductase [Pedobacter sp. MC2016-15]